MHFGTEALLVQTVDIEAMLGILLLFAWVQNTGIYAVVWWGFAYLLRAFSIYLFGMFGKAPEFVSIDVANVLLFASFAVTWTGARIFGNRSIHPLGLVAGPALWWIASRIPVVSESHELRVLLGAGIITTYTWLAAYEFWRDRDDYLVSRWPTIFVLTAYGSLILLHTPISAMMPWSATNEVYASAWLTTQSFGALLFTIAVAFMLLAIAKERNEARQKTMTARLWRWPTSLSRAK